MPQPTDIIDDGCDYLVFDLQSSLTWSSMICLAAAIVSASEPVGSSEEEVAAAAVTETIGAAAATGEWPAKTTCTVGGGGDDRHDDDGLGGVRDVIIAADDGASFGCKSAVIGGGSSPGWRVHHFISHRKAFINDTSQVQFNNLV